MIIKFSITRCWYWRKCASTFSWTFWGTIKLPLPIFFSSFLWFLPLKLLEIDSGEKFSFDMNFSSQLTFEIYIEPFVDSIFSSDQLFQLEISFTN